MTQASRRFTKTRLFIILISKKEHGLDDVDPVIVFSETASCVVSVPVEKPSSREVLLCVPL